MPELTREALSNVDLEQTTGFLLIQVALRWERQIEECIAPLDLTKTQFFILSITHFLTQKDQIVTQSLIASYGNMDVMMISQVARRLEGKGFLVRNSHPTDSRAKVLGLTENGYEILLQARKKVLVAWQAFLSELPDGDTELRAILRKIYYL